MNMVMDMIETKGLTRKFGQERGIFDINLEVPKNSIYGFIGLMQSHFPLGWTCYQHVIVLAIIAVVSLIIACLFGAQIPDCYVQ